MKSPSSTSRLSKSASVVRSSLQILVTEWSLSKLQMTMMTTIPINIVTRRLEFEVLEDEDGVGGCERAGV